MSKELLKELSKPLSEEAIQRTFKQETKKGYDTTGYAYQYAVDRFNEQLGKDWGYEWKMLHEEQGKFKDKEYNGKTVPGLVYWDITVDVGIWIEDAKPRSCAGHHISTTYGDALKGAITNGFKKAAAFWGVGRDAFAGTIDDDNKPYPDEAENKINKHFGQPDHPPIEVMKMKVGNMTEYSTKALRELKWTLLEVYRLHEKNEFDPDKTEKAVRAL